MDSKITKVTEDRNAQGLVETNIETVDYKTSAGHGQVKRTVQVVHHPHTPSGSTTDGGLLANAVAVIESVESTFQSSKDAISGK